MLSILVSGRWVWQSQFLSPEMWWLTLGVGAVGSGDTEYEQRYSLLITARFNWTLQGQNQVKSSSAFTQGRGTGAVYTFHEVWTLTFEKYVHVLRQCTYSSFIKISPPLLKGLANVALQRLGMLLHKGVEPSPIYLLCVLHGPILGMFGSPPARLNFQNRLKK